jgi:sugar lactone lactonase YvrE
MSVASRRQFLAACAAPAVFASSKSGSRLPVTGSGEHQYEVHHDWGELPARIAYGNTHGVCVDSQGFVYVHHTVNAASQSDDTVVVFDPRGRFVRSWGGEFKGGAHGLAIRREGSEEFLYFCDTRRAVVAKYSLRGERVWELGYPEESPAYQPTADGKRPRYSPTNLAIASSGDIYVADGYGSSFVNVYDARGRWKFTFGGKGREAGRLDCPHGIAIDRRSGTERVLIADRTNRRLQYFSLAGEHLGFAAEGSVKLPCHFDHRGSTLLVPDLEARVTLLDGGDRLLAHLGEDPSGAWGELRKQPRERFPAGRFICPHSACFDAEGNIFVVEWVEAGRVTKLRRIV